MLAYRPQIRNHVNDVIFDLTWNRRWANKASMQLVRYYESDPIASYVLACVAFCLEHILLHVLQLYW